MKKGVTMTIASILVFSMLASGCASTNDTKDLTSPTNTTASEQPTITLTVVLDERNPADSTNYAINYIEEHTGVKLAFNLLPFTDWEAKLNLMLSSGTYGDVIVAPTKKAKVEAYAKEGIIVPVTQFYNNDSIYYKSILDQRPNYEKIAYAQDGEMYGFLNISECYHCQIYPKLWFNYGWLDKLGLNVPETTDEFYDVLVAIRDGDPNGNGEKDEIPLTGSFEHSCPLEYYLMNSFIPFDFKTMAYAKDGQVIFSADKEEYREGMRYMKKLLDEGLMDQSNFTQKADQMQQVIRQDPPRVAGYTADHFAMGIDMENREVNENLFALPPVAGPKGVRYLPSSDFSDVDTSYSWLITDNCKDVAAAFKVGDFMLSEECTIVKSYGIEGEGWGKLDAPTKSVLGLEAEYWTKANYSANSDDDSYFKNTLYIAPMNSLFEFREKFNPNPDDIYTSQGYEARLAIETQKLMDYRYPENLPRNISIDLSQEEQDAFLEIRTMLTNFVKTSTTQFITGELSIDKDWDSYVSQLQQYKVDEYLKTYQECFDARNAAAK